MEILGAMNVKIILVRNALQITLLLLESIILFRFNNSPKYNPTNPNMLPDAPAAITFLKKVK